MEAIVNIANFKKALTTVKGTVPRTSALPILRGVVIDAVPGSVAVPGSIMLTTTDLDVTSQVVVDAVVNKPGRIIVEHATLAKLVKGKGDLLIRCTDNDEAEFVNGITSKLRTLPLADYPKTPTAGSSSTSYPLDPAMLATVLPAASREDSRPILTGVRFGENGEIVATDSYRLHLADSGVEFPELLIPARTLALVVKLGLPATMHVETTYRSEKYWLEVTAEEADDTCRTRQMWSHIERRNITIHEKPMERPIPVHQVRITAPGHVWFSRIIEGEFPNYRQLIPSSYPNRLLVERDRLVAALEGVRAVVKDSTTPVRLIMDPESDELTITAITQEVGESKAVLPAKYQGVAVTVAFNPAFLIDCVKVGAGDFVTIETVDGLKPAVIRDNDNPGAGLRLLMPVRVP